MSYNTAWIDGHNYLRSKILTITQESLNAYIQLTLSNNTGRFTSEEYTKELSLILKNLLNNLDKQLQKPAINH